MIRKLKKYPLANGLCVRRYGNTLRDSVFADLKWAIHKLHMDDEFECTVSPMQITHKYTGQKILFRGLDDGLKITSISVDYGVLCFVWIEEAYEISNEDDFNKLDMSIRGEVPEGYFKQITLTFNPWSATSWIKARFFDNPDDDVFTKTTTWECNEWLDDADRNIFLKMKKNNPRRYRIEGEGEWGIAEGLIYERVLFENFDVDAIRAIPGIKSAFGLDFGFTDPNAFTCFLIDNTAMRIYVFDEWYKTGVTNKIIAQAIKDKGYGGQRITCDSAEPKSIAELQEEGINAESSRKGKDSVNHGIQLIQNYEIIVHEQNCPEFKKEIQNYCWAKDKDGKPTDKPDHEFSHGMDSMRYAVTKALLADTFSFD
jgi:phage terminase large subunit